MCFTKAELSWGGMTEYPLLHHRFKEINLFHKLSLFKIFTSVLFIKSYFVLCDQPLYENYYKYLYFISHSVFSNELDF